MKWDKKIIPSRRTCDEKMQQQLLHSPRSKGGHYEEAGVGGGQRQWEREREREREINETCTA
jgi:hypothetical protein